MVYPIQIQQAALRHAFGSTEGDLAKVPKRDRPATIAAVAVELGLAPSEVREILDLHWMETSGRSGAASLNGQPRRDKSTRRPAGALDLLSIQIVGLDDREPTHNAQSVHGQFAGDAPTVVDSDQPLDYEYDLKAKNRKVDEMLDRVPFGHYGKLPLDKLDDDDPVLQMRIYRGMGGRDPAAVMLQTTRHLVPEGNSADYEHFKTYDHKQPIDAYEWSLDPFVAAKSVGGKGTVVSMTLADLRAQGAEVMRKHGDTEGGFFVASVVAPEHRVVAHEEGYYRLSSRRPPNTDPAALTAAKKLRRALENEGGWSALAKASPKFADHLAGAQSVEAKKLVHHWLGQLEKKAPEDRLIARARKTLEDLPEAPQDKLQAAERLLRKVLLRMSEFIEVPPEKVWTL